MSTFGEIVEPDSRNTWEDWDENISGHPTELRWVNNVSPPDKISMLLLLEGKYLADSIKNQTEYKLKLVNAILEANLKLYKTDTLDCYICVVKDHNLLLSSEIVELMKKYIIASEEVIAILTKPLVEYQVQEVLTQTYIIRSLSTSKPVSKLTNIKISKLEQPNIISGISAGVLSLREHLNLPGAVVVCYMEHPEEYKIDELQELFQKLNVVSLESKPSNLLNSNLYS